jgi:hypothetical protein
MFVGKSLAFKQLQAFQHEKRLIKLPELPQPPDAPHIERGWNGSS